MRRWMAGLMALTLSVSLTACGSKQDQAKGGATAEAPKDLKKVSLVLDWYPNAVHSFIYVAQKEGYFKQEGLDVEIKMPAENPTDGIKLVGSGKETFALYYQPDVLVARNEGIPIVSTAAIVRHPLNIVMTSEGSGINSPKDVAGKTMGYPSIDLDLAIVKTMVKTDGGDPSAVKFQDVGFDLIPAITSKRVGAISGGYLNHEKLLLERDGMKVKSFSPTDYGVPNYYELVLITGEQTLQKDPDVANAFWRALDKGFQKTKADPAAALQVLLDAQSKDAPLDKEIETKSLSLLLPLMDENGKVKFGSQSSEDWQKVADWMSGQGLLKGSVKPDEAFKDIEK